MVAWVGGVFPSHNMLTTQKIWMPHLHPCSQAMLHVHHHSCLPVILVGSCAAASRKWWLQNHLAWKVSYNCALQVFMFDCLKVFCVGK